MAVRTAWGLVGLVSGSGSVVGKPVSVLVMESVSSTSQRTVFFGFVSVSGSLVVAL